MHYFLLRILLTKDKGTLGTENISVEVNDETPTFIKSNIELFAGWLLDTFKTKGTMFSL